MWWSSNPVSDLLRIPTKINPGGARSFNVPTVSLDALENQLNICEADDDVPVEPVYLPHIFKRITNIKDSTFSALPISDEKHWDSDTSPHTSSTPVNNEPSYWSVDHKFWETWKSEESEIRQKALAEAKSNLEKSQRAAADEAARLEANRRKAVENAEIVVKEVEIVSKVDVTSEMSSSGGPSASGTVSLGQQYENIIEGGKEYRSEFISTWRDISLGVSTTAANSRSVQLNANKLLSCLSKAAQLAGDHRGAVVAWLCAVCGSRIVSQAVSGNKALVWSFAYLARIIAEKFPEVITMGIVGELYKIGSYTLHGSVMLPMKSEDPKDYEQVARFWVALLCVCNDEPSIWKWVTVAVNDLNKRTTFLSSWEAQWNLMKVYIWMDVGLFDFRRLFGRQSLAMTDILETNVFPKIDAELQTVQQSTSVSVQFRFYLDSCYNILQSRKYTQAPEGQILAAAKESELNPDL